jgi:hypothetical protein
MDLCVVCGILPVEHRHHVSYKENKTINVCAECHSRIHHGYFPEFYPVDSKDIYSIYITKEAKDLLKSVDTKKPEYLLASELIIKGLNKEAD